MSRCSIILVHGTWGRGFFPKRREVSLLPPNKRWWFEEGSQFHAGLDAALKSASLNWPVRAFLWSGANSVHARDCAARELSEQLRKDLQDPDATAVIIAHSHGGNVALRALQHLESMAGRIRVITLATPFLRVFARRSLQVPYGVEILMWLAIWLILTLSVLLGIIWIVSATVGLPDSEWFFGSMFAIVAVLAGVSTYFIGERLNIVFGNPHAALAIEEKVHYDTKGAAASRMLVIRGVDDEASLSLAAGSIGSRLSYLVLVGAIPAIVTMTMFVSYMSFVIKLPSAVFGILMFSSFFGALIFFFVPGVFKSFFGREFLVNALVCDISVDSAPDTVGQVEVITLRPVEVARKNFSIATDPQRFGWDPNFMGMPFSKSSWHLRHGIYNHPDCVHEIVRWLRRET